MIFSSIGQGLLWGILGLGIFMTYRILNFPDMTAEGSFRRSGLCCGNCCWYASNRRNYFGHFCGDASRTGDRPALYKRQNSCDIGGDLSHVFFECRYAVCYETTKFIFIKSTEVT